MRLDRKEKIKENERMCLNCRLMYHRLHKEAQELGESLNSYFCSSLCAKEYRQMLEHLQNPSRRLE